MKKVILALITLGLAGSTFGIDKAELNHRIRKLTAKLVVMQRRLDKSIPPETLKKAQGLSLIDRTKAGFIFAYQGGAGVALIKQPNSEQWSPAAFVAANEASLGLQLGGEQGFFVILLMNTNTTRWLTEGKIEFGG